MYQNNSELAKLLADYAEITPIPDLLVQDKIAIWKHNFNDLDDWNHFVGGQKTMHTYYTEKYVDAWVMLNTLSQGNSANTYEGMSRYNDKLTVLTKEFVSVASNELFALRDNRDKFYFGASYEIANQVNGVQFKGMIVLQEITSFLNDNFEEQDMGYTSNIMVGNYGETIKVPLLERNSINQIVGMGTEEIIIPKATKLILDLTNASGTMGCDVISKNETIIDASYSVDDVTKYCIVPTQFNTWTIDNYGIANPADTTNQLKALAYNQNISQSVQSGSNAWGSMQEGGTSAGSLASKIGGTVQLFSSMVNGANKMFMGDSRSLSSETAITSRFLESDSSFLKLFIQPATGAYNITSTDMMGGTNNYFKMAKFGIQLNGNRAANLLQAAGAFLQDLGTADQEAITTLPNPELVINNPTNNNGDNQHYKMVGTKLLQNNWSGITKTLPWLKAPYASGNHKTQAIDINNYFRYGVPRKHSDAPLAPLLHPRDWTLGFRYQGFRPSPYTWINWPIMYPAEIGIYDVENTGNPVEYIGKATMEVSGGSSYWSKGFTVGELADKNVGNNRKLKTHLEMLLNNNQEVAQRLELMAITKSSAKVKAYDASGNVIKEYNFKTSGQRFNNGAYWTSILEL